MIMNCIFWSQMKCFAKVNHIILILVQVDIMLHQIILKKESVHLQETIIEINLLVLNQLMNLID